MIAIYALYLNGVCVYVGQSNSPVYRYGKHKGSNGNFAGEPITMRVLRWCAHESAGRIEQQIIRAMKRQGLPLRNVATNQQRGETPWGDQYRIVETGEIVRGRAAVSARLGCTVAAIGNAIRRETWQVYERRFERVA